MTLEDQPIPAKSRCPECGDEPTDESLVEHHLSNMGYLHDDIELRCENDHTWVCGVPIGRDDEYGEDLHCDSCGDRFMLVHRVQITREAALQWGRRDRESLPINVHLKCPNGCEDENAEACFYFKSVKRESDERGIALIGYPQITGSREGAEPYGWNESAGK